MKSINSILEDFATEHKIENEFIFSQILNIWNEHFPEIIRNNISLKKFENGTIFFHSNSSAWKKEIMLRKNELIDKLNSQFGSKIIQKIKI
jgi:predicted nucleic acid-binding Zn ribbon protein